MQRIEQLLQKLSAMAAKGDENELIDIDLMLDHVKTVYSELLELRNELAATDMEEDMEDETEESEDEAEEQDGDEETEEEEEETTEEEDDIEEDDIYGEIPGEAIQEVKMPEVSVEAAKVNLHYTPPSKDIRTAIGINDKYLFINELFGSDKANYEHTLDELNKLDSYDKAMEWLNENVLFVNETEDNAEIAQAFYDAISTFFSDK